MTGPAPGVVISPKFAYFVSIRYGSDGHSLAPNSAGGFYDLVKVSLSDGKSAVVPFSSSMNNPRIGMLEGQVFAYSAPEEGLWYLSEPSDKLIPVVLPAPSSKAVSTDVRSKDLQFSYVALPSLGIFRVTSDGDVTRVLDSELHAAHDAKTFSAADKVQGGTVGAFPVQTEGRSAIGLLQRVAGKLSVAVVDPDTGFSSREIEIPSAAVRESIYPLSGESIGFLNASKSTVQMTSNTGATKDCWSIDVEMPGANAKASRIVSMR
jgi:hypothetical protein